LALQDLAGVIEKGVIGGQRFESCERTDPRSLGITLKSALSRWREKADGEALSRKIVATSCCKGCSANRPRRALPLERFPATGY